MAKTIAAKAFMVSTPFVPIARKSGGGDLKAFINKGGGPNTRAGGGGNVPLTFSQIRNVRALSPSILSVSYTLPGVAQVDQPQQSIIHIIPSPTSSSAIDQPQQSLVHAVVSSLLSLASGAPPAAAPPPATSKIKRPR